MKRWHAPLHNFFPTSLAASSLWCTVQKKEKKTKTERREKKRPAGKGKKDKEKNIVKHNTCSNKSRGHWVKGAKARQYLFRVSILWAITMELCVHTC